MNMHELPFRHIRCFNYLLPEQCRKMVEALPELIWELYDRGSYRYEVSSIDYETEFYKNNQDIVNKFISPEFIHSLSEQLGVKFGKCKDFSFHKMEVGDFSFKHTDKNGYGHVARLVFYLSDPIAYRGGNLNLYDSRGKHICEVLRMPVNSFLSFRLTDKFYHEVEVITEGVRYCISITYW